MFIIYQPENAMTEKRKKVFLKSGINQHIVKERLVYCVIFKFLVCTPVGGECSPGRPSSEIVRCSDSANGKHRDFISDLLGHSYFVKRNSTCHSPRSRRNSFKSLNY